MTSPSLAPDARPSSPPPSRQSEPPAPASWHVNAGLFLATVAAVFVTGLFQGPDDPLASTSLLHAGQFTAALLGILLCHEFGHYIAARIHKVDASLPYFIPLPLLSPFGTMGAVIRMRGHIPTRRALLDIGAAGPLAGMVVAVPLYIWGIAHSRVVPAEGLSSGTLTLGESILTRLLDRLAGPAVPDGMELMLSPVAFAAWGGMLVTMLNLIPVAQLDGGHVAYALFGTKQDKYARVIHRSMLVFFLVSIGSYLVRDVRNGFGLLHMGRAIGSSFFWFVWFELLAVLGTLANANERRSRDGELTIGARVIAVVGLGYLGGVLQEHPSPYLGATWVAAFALLMAMERKGGALRRSNLLDHPPTGAAPLDGTRKAIAIITLALFVLLFMPTPIGT